MGYVQGWLRLQNRLTAVFAVLASLFVAIAGIYSIMIWLFLFDFGRKKEGLAVFQALVSLAIGGLTLYVGAALMGIQSALVAGTIHNFPEALEFSKTMIFELASRRQIGYASFIWIIYSAIFGRWFFGEKMTKW